MSASFSVDEAAAIYSGTGGGQEGGSTSMPASDPGRGEEGRGESMVETLEQNRRGLVDSGGGDSAEKPEMNVGEEGGAAGADEVSGAVVPEGADAGESRNGTGVEALEEKVASFEEKGQGDVVNVVKEHDLVDGCFQDMEVGNLGSRGQEMGDGCSGDQELIADALETGNMVRIALKEAKAECMETVADLGGNVEEVMEIRNGTEFMKEDESCPEKKASTMNDVMSGDLVDRKAQVTESNVGPSELGAGDELGAKLKLDVKEAGSVMGVTEAAATVTGGVVEVDGLKGEPANGGKVDVMDTGNKTEFLEGDEPYIEKEQSKANDAKGHDLVGKQLQAEEGILDPKGLEMEDGLGSKEKSEINGADGENVVECEKKTDLMKKQITNQNLDCKVRGQNLVDEHLQAPEGGVGSIALETENKLGADEKLEASVGDAGFGVGTVKTQADVALASVEADRSEGVAGPGQIQVGVAEFSNSTELTKGVSSCPEEDKSVVGKVTDLQAAGGALGPKVLETENILDHDQKPEPGVLEVGCLSGDSNNIGGEEAGRLESIPELGQAQHKVPETSNGMELTAQAMSCPQKNQSMVTAKGGHDLADAHVQASEGEGSRNQSVFVESTAGNKDMEVGLFLGGNKDTWIWSAGCGTEEGEASMVSGDQDRDHEASVSQVFLVNTNQDNQEEGNAIHREEIKEVDSLPVDDAIIEQGDHVVKDSDLADSGVEVNNPDSYVHDDLMGSGPIVTSESEAGLAESAVDAAPCADNYPSNKNWDKLDIITADGNSVLAGAIMESESRERQLVDENTSGKRDIAMADSCPDLESEFVGTCTVGVQTADTCPPGSVLKDSKSSVAPDLQMASELYVSGSNQERETQSIGLLVERSDSIVHGTEYSPKICQNEDMESRVLKDETYLPETCHEKEDLAQDAEADKKAPLLVDSVANIVIGAGGTAEENVQVGKHGHSKIAEKQVVKHVSIRPRTSTAEKDQHASYFLPLQDKDTFIISDLVWGKVKSHPWWPGQIFDPSDASDLAMKYQKKDNLLVAYFGDKTFAWCEEPQLKPFETYFSQMEKQSSSDAFVTAVNDALGEVSRRTELGMACFCLPKGTYANIKYQTVENAGIREGISRAVFDRSLVVDYFEPGRLIEYIEALAQLPTGGANRLELVIAQAQLKAFYRSKGYLELPVFQTGGGLIENDSEVSPSGSKLFRKDTMEHSTPTSMELNLGKHKRGRGRPSNKEKQMLEDAKKQKNLSELMQENILSPLANDGKIGSAVKIDGNLMSLSSEKKRKVIDFDSDYSERGKKKWLVSLGDLVTKSPSPTPGSSFKVGECIRRVASQLTGSPPILRCHGETFQKSVSKAEHRRFDVVDAEASTHTGVDSPKLKIGISEDYTSLGEMLSQLFLAARDPMKGYSFLSTTVSFFTDFRNFCVSSSSEEKKNVQKIGSKRGRKRTVNPQSPSSDMSTADHMQDSYWSDMIYHNSSTNDVKRKGDSHMRSLRKRRKSGGKTSLSLSLDRISGTARHLQVGTISPKMKQALTTERSVISLEEKIVDECTPTALILSFNRSSPLPSQTDLIRIFSRYGPLKEAETEVQSMTNHVKIVFKKRADAEIAFSSAGKYSIFGPALLSYCLRYLPSTPSASPNTPPQGKNDAGSAEGGKLEVPDDASPNTLSQGKNDAIPIEGSSSEVPSDASPNMRPEGKNDAVRVEGRNTQVPGDASLNITRVNNDVVLIKGGNLEVPDASPNTILDKNDAECTLGGNLENSGSIAPNITPQNENDAVLVDGGNLEIPGSTFPKAKQLDNNDAVPNAMQDEKDAAPIEDGSLDIPGNTSPNTTPQDNNDAAVIEDGSLEVPGYTSPSTTAQDKNDAAPVEDSSLEVPGNTYPNTTTQGQNDAALVQDDNVGPKHSCSSPKDVGNKENICTAQEDNLDVLASSKETPMQTKRAKRGGGYNLRKSLAWNQAFFMEEGVLNPLELSMLSGSVTKSSGCFLSGINGEMSPLMEYQKSGDRNDVEVNTSFWKDALCQKHCQNRATITSFNFISFWLLPFRMENVQYLFDEEKRVANTNATNPTSKLPKFVPTRSQASSLPMTSRNIISTPKSFKTDHTARVSVDHGIGTRGFSSNTRKESGCPPLPAKSSSHDLSKHMAPLAEKGTTGFKMNLHPSGSGMASSLYPQNSHQVSRAPPLPAHVKPSALRLPSPSLGFFRQGKFSPSYGNYSQRNIQQLMPGIPPLRKPVSLKKTDELRPALSTARECTEGPIASESCARTVVVGSSQTYSAANSLSCSTATVDTNPSMKENTGMKEMDMMNKRTSGSLSCQTSSQDQLGSSCFSVGDNIDKQSYVFSLGKLGHHGDNLMSQIDTQSSVKESRLISENSNDAYPSIVESSESKLSSSKFSSQMSPKKLEGSESKQLHEGDLGVDNLEKYPLVGDLGDESSLLNKDKQSAGNSDLISNTCFGFTVRNADLAASPKTESSLKLSKEQMAGASISHSTELDCSLDEKTGTHVQIIDQGSVHLASGSSSSLSEESLSTFSEDRKIQDCQAQSEVKKLMNSMQDRELMSDKSKPMDRLKLDLVPPRHQLHAVPFSDEWLAALESFGEEILELKTGPVQNSPPDKALPEPGPWSPAPLAEKGTTGFKMNLHPSGSGMASSLYPQNSHQVSRAPPLPAHVKPSALRLPSPSLGFFRQGKFSPSYGNYSQRNIQQLMPGIPPLRKPVSLKKTDELRPALSTARECTEGPIASESCARTVVVGSSQTYSAANSLSCSTATVDTNPSMKENTGMKEMDMMNKRTSGSLSCQTSSQDQLGSSCFSVGDNIDKQSYVFSLGKLGHHGDNLMSQIDTQSSVKESRLISENSNDAYPSIVESSESKLSSSKFSSQMSPKKLEGSESKQLHEGDLGVDNLEKYPLLEMLT
ncbi:hypothetical protein COCNU_04G002910 [Cocos nucifera]|uniref:PWWP domain-containing protein n=1 Tax=Cocos nucifera TaxID=13894 RepID=A0A8K0MZE5_COCNU|nr:hypothetical protein COCNU_04G002910 [Cocos nucifera]